METRFCAILAGCILAQGAAFAQGLNARLISVADSSQPASVTASGYSRAPVVSADGRYVAFASAANNIATNALGRAYPQPNPASLQVYLRDRTAGTASLISINLAGTAGGRGDSLPTGISPDGRFVLFESDATNLVSATGNQTWNVFVRDTRRAPFAFGEPGLYFIQQQQFIHNLPERKIVRQLLHGIQD